MKILESITSGYKKIAAGIAIVSFLAIMYMAMIPGGIPGASAYVIDIQSGDPIQGALVFIKEWPLLWNTTTNETGAWNITGVSIGTYNLTARREGYFPNTTQITVNEGENPAINFNLVTSKDWYFSEGYNSPTQSTYISLLNPSSSQKANVIITYIKTDGSTITDPDITVLNETTRITARPYRHVAAAHATKIISDIPIVAERAMYFRNTMYGGQVEGGHITIGVKSPNTTWYFSEGYNSPTQSTYISLLNPNSSQEANVVISYILSDGSIVPDPDITVINETTRVTARPYRYVGGAHATKIVSDIPIVAERAMYFRSTMFGGEVNDGTITIGMNAPSTNWDMAGGNNSDAKRTYISIMNPGTEKANLSITYMKLDGTNIPDTTAISVNGTSRITARPYNFFSGEFATNITSDKPIIAEETVYFRESMLGGIVDGGHATIGVSNLSNEWYFSEGYTSSTQNTIIAIGNPNDQPATLTITYMQPDGSIVPDTTTTSIGARSRATAIPVNFVTAAFSTRIVSSLPVVAERGMYFRNTMFGGTVSGGHNTIGVRGPLS